MVKINVDINPVLHPLIFFILAGPDAYLDIKNILFDAI